MWRLEVLDWAGVPAWRWRWRLLDDAGAFVTDHQVELDQTAWEFGAFVDLHHYLRWFAAPDRRWAHQAELVEQVGEWVGRQVLGSRIGAELARRRGPVRIEVPDDAAVLGYLPWELARVNGRTLAGHRTNLVIVPEHRDPVDKQDVGAQLRMLAVFSLPDGVGALNLRKERVALAQLVQRIAKVNNKAIELRVLQYGATRERLEDALDEAAGWDVVHLSGHGLAGGLVLEKADGARDLITSEQLVDLLDRGREQIKLVTLSACESAAVTAAEHLRRLGLGPAVRDDPAGSGGTAPRSDETVTGEDPAGRESTAAPAFGDEPPPTTVLPAVAAALVAGLDCAVLAMRYPVVDDFAIALTGSFYDLLLGKGQPVARALALSLTQRTVVPEHPGPATPVLSVGTPVLVGPRAADLTLTAPPGTGTVNTDTAKLAALPEQPARFVGRVGALTRASEVLAPESGRPGVVLHGMAGAGKTACALELAYTHERSFPLMAWFAAPEETAGGTEIRPVLASFALALERQLPKMPKWSHLVENPDELPVFLPQLTQVFEANRVLLVFDNVESLLTEAGEWRDERWGWVLAALLGHTGLSRVVVTSRRLPVKLPGSVLVEPVHALSAAESVLLARELRHLRGLIDGTDLPAGLTPETGRDVAARVLEVVQGHPKLLELADGAAADPAELQLRLADADAAWRERGTRLDGFLAGERSAASGADFWAVLAGWTRSAAAGLPDDTALLLRVVCGVEDVDRAPNVLAFVWPRVWERTGRSGAAPDLDQLLAVLVGRALLAEERDPGSGNVIGWRVHPGVADAVRAATDPALGGVIDAVSGDGWLGALQAAQAQETEQQVGAWLVRAARSAAPYLLRRHRWDDLGFAAEQVLFRDPGVGAAVVLAPMLKVAVEATRGGEDPQLALELGRTHAGVVARLDPARGEALLGGLLDTAVTGGHYANASALAGDLVNRYLGAGRYGEALALVDRKVDYSRRAGFGPWTQLLDQGRRLQIEQAQGRAREVLDAVEGLRERMATLPAHPDPATERVDVWNVRETLLNTGVLAAQDLGWWERALALNTENLASMRGRGAGAHAQAVAVFNDYFPLLRLGRLGEARELLLGSREVFEQADDLLNLEKALSGLADVEDVSGHRDRAVDLEREALRFSYAVGDPEDIGVSHYNLANYLQRGGGDPELVGAHRVAAVVLAHRTSSGRLSEWLPALGRLLAAECERVPRSFARVCALVGQVPGVDLAGLLARLSSRAPDPDAAVQAVLAAAPDAAAAEQASRVEQALAGWEPMLSALHVSATAADPDIRANASATLAAVLDSCADTDDWRTLVPLLRRIQASERDAAVLLDGLDEIDTAIARRALDVLAGTITVDPDAWRTLDADADG